MVLLAKAPQTFLERSDVQCSLMTKSHQLLNKSVRNVTAALPLIFFIGLLAAFLAYGLLYIYRTSFVVNGQRTFALFDDAMISMRYARNFANGNGLVWNPGGERVEGFSNPLWVAYMTIFHLLPIPTRLMSLSIQISGLIFLFFNLIVVRKISQLVSSNWLVPVFAVFLTAFYYPLNTWALQGMEVSALTLLVSLAIWRFLKAHQSNKFTLWPYVFLGIGTLFRVDVAVPFLLVLVFSFFYQPKHRKLHLIWGLGLLLVCLLSQTAARLWYYGDFLPNTYYLKLGGVPLISRIFQGLRIFLLFVWDSGWLLVSLPLLLFALWRNSDYSLLGILILGQVAYSVYVGGDSWDHQGGANRFISIAMPLFFVLFAETLNRIRTSLIVPRGNKNKIFLSDCLLAAFVLASLFSFNKLRVQDSAAKLMLRETPIFVEGTKRYVGIASTLSSISFPQAKIAVVAAGNIPYFYEANYLDLLGKNDKHIAHLLLIEVQGYHDDFYSFQPGHVKWDLPYSITFLKPDIIAQLPVPFAEAEQYMSDYIKVTIDDIPYYLLVGSPNIRWENIQK